MVRTRPASLIWRTLDMARTVPCSNGAIDLNGRADGIGGVHLVLALFFFSGCRAAAVLESCGIEWRPLHSLARRLIGVSYDDW